MPIIFVSKYINVIILFLFINCAYLGRGILAGTYSKGGDCPSPALCRLVCDLASRPILGMPSAVNLLEMK